MGDSRTQRRRLVEPILAAIEADPAWNRAIIQQAVEAAVARHMTPAWARQRGLVIVGDRLIARTRLQEYLAAHISPVFDTAPERPSTTTMNRVRRTP